VGTEDNAIITTLPAGTRLHFHDPAQATAFGRLFLRAVFVDPQTVEIHADLKIASPAYLEERNRTEELLIRDNAALQHELRAARGGVR
jgi:hypothetical protein